MDDYLEIVRSMKPKPNASRRSYQPLNTQQNVPETTSYPQRASLNPELLSSPRPNTTLINNIPTQPFHQYPATYSVPYSVSPQNIAPSSINYLHEGFPVITTTTSQFIPRPTQSVYQSSYNNVAPPASEMHSSTFNQFSQINQRNRVSPQQEGRRKSSLRENERKVQRETTERKYNKETRKSKRKSQRTKYLSILAGIIVLLIVFLGYKYMSDEKSLVVFCDSDNIEGRKREGCIDCPDYGECREGRWRGCERGFETFKNLCVKEEHLENAKKYYQYIDFIDDKLAQHLGDRECNTKLRHYFKQEDVEDQLKKEFKKDPFFLKHEEKIFDYLQSTAEKKNHPHLYKEGKHYETTRKPEPSASCRIQLLWKEKVSVTLILIWILLFVLSVEYGRRYVLKKREYQRLARELYDEILVYLSHWEKIRVKQIKKDFEEWAQGYNYRRLWRRLEEIKKKDCKIYSYLDYYQNNVEEFWMLPK